MKKRMLAFGLCIAFLVSILGGCTKKEQNQTASKSAVETSSTTATTDKELKPMEISVAIWGIQDAFDSKNAANDTIFNDLCKKFNVTIKPVGVTWNDYQEKNKVWAASGTLPDVFVDALATDNFGLYKTWAEQGIIKEIPSDLSSYPNLKTLFDLDSVKALALDGKYYMIPRGGDLTQSVSAASGMSRAVIYRKDWAEKAGFKEAPKNYDELVKMTKAMMAQHPNAAGIAMNKPDYMGTLALDIFPELATPSAWVYENNQWIPNYASKKMVPYLERLQKLYKQGILDPDFITQKDGDGIGKFTSGNACVMLGASNFDSTVFMKSNKDVKNTNDAIGFITPFAAADGKSYVFTNTPYWSESYISSQVNDEKLSRILMMLDYMYSHEFAVTINNGVKDVDWKKTDKGNVSLMGDTTFKDKYPVSNSIGYLASWFTGVTTSPDAVISSNPYISSYTKLYNETDAYEKENCIEVPINFNVLLMNNDKKSNISSLWTEFISSTNNFIIGSENPETAWKGMISDFNKKGLNDAIQSVTKQAKDEGIEP